MADERFIPNRPNPDTSKIPASDKDMIAYMVAFNVPNQKAFALWHPEFLDSSGKLNKTGRAACTQFFNYSKNREYADAYKETLLKSLGKEQSEDVDFDDPEISESTKKRTITKMLNRLVKLIGDGNLTSDDLKNYSEIMKKVGWLKDEVEQMEAPRRYLPERCGACAYRSFVESHVGSGEIINECDFCRTRRFAEENGWHFDVTKNLDLPKEDNNQ